MLIECSDTPLSENDDYFRFFEALEVTAGFLLNLQLPASLSISDYSTIVLLYQLLLQLSDM